MCHLGKVRSLLLALLISIVPAASFAGVLISVNIAPPILPVYTQPVCPGDGYLWTPGYWAYGDAGYYWVPGAWVFPPRVGLLWTPGYWGFAGGVYLWHAGYWGPHVGFYGGVNYGYGYMGVGFVGGRWAGGHFLYNTAILRVNPAIIHHTYVDRTVIRNTVVNRASFNGRGGVLARPTPGEMAAAREQHFGATSRQMAHERTASLNRANFASFNHGRPGAAMNRPTENRVRNNFNGAQNRGQFNQARVENRQQGNRQGRAAANERSGGNRAHNNGGGGGKEDRR